MKAPTPGFAVRLGALALLLALPCAARAQKKVAPVTPSFNGHVEEAAAPAPAESRRHRRGDPIPDLDFWIMIAVAGLILWWHPTLESSYSSFTIGEQRAAERPFPMSLFFALWAFIYFLFALVMEPVYWIIRITVFVLELTGAGGKSSGGGFSCGGGSAGGGGAGGDW